MRVMVIIKANKNSEAGVLPDAKLLTEMTSFNEELVKAEVMLAGEGLQPSSKGKRLVFSNGEKKIIDGPFPETDALVAGFWLWQVKSMDEAVEWAKRIPVPENLPPDAAGNIEIRQVFEMDDFGPEFTPELRALEDSRRQRAAENASR